MMMMVVIFLVVLLNALLRLRQEAKSCCCPFLQQLLLSLPPCSPARLCAWTVLRPAATPLQQSERIYIASKSAMKSKERVAMHMFVMFKLLRLSCYV